MSTEETTPKPTTINIDPALHLAMKDAAKKQGINVSFLYSEAIEKYLTDLNKKLAPRVS